MNVAVGEEEEKDEMLRWIQEEKKCPRPPHFPLPSPLLAVVYISRNALQCILMTFAAAGIAVCLTRCVRALKPRRAMSTTTVLQLLCAAGSIGSILANKALTIVTNGMTVLEALTVQMAFAFVVLVDFFVQ